jgi:ribbon-helix-helix protein
MRITARLDENYEQKLKAIQQKTHLNTTEIIKQALDLMYEKTELSGWEKNQKLIELLAGIGEGPEDLSVNYKEYLFEGLKEKHGIK